jgi:hypothetical protein
LNVESFPSIMPSEEPPYHTQATPKELEEQKDSTLYASVQESHKHASAPADPIRQRTENGAYNNKAQQHPKSGIAETQIELSSLSRVIVEPAVNVNRGRILESQGSKPQQQVLAHMAGKAKVSASSKVGCDSSRRPLEDPPLFPVQRLIPQRPA